MKKIGCLLILISMFAGPMVHANGGVSGGGGKGVLCGSQLRTLDLYEAAEIHHLPVPHTSLDLDANLRIFGPDMEAYFEEFKVDPKSSHEIDRFMSGVPAFLKTFVDIPVGSRLPLTDDATLPTLLPGCAVVQIAIYSDDDQIFRDSEYWNLLSVEDQAALILHEALYRGGKKMKARTSDHVRKLIGLLFAQQLPETILAPTFGVPQRLICTAGDGNAGTEAFETYLVDEVRGGVSGLAMYFPIFKTEFQMGRVSAFFPDVTRWQFANFPSEVLVGSLMMILPLDHGMWKWGRRPAHHSLRARFAG